MAQTIVMLCEKREWGDFPKGPNWVFEPKLDGIRILGNMQPNAVKLVGRSGEEYTKKFPEVVDDLRKYPVSFISDGELCLKSGDFRSLGGRVHLKDRFKISLRAKIDPGIYYIFDVLGVNGQIVARQPLRERKQILNQIGEQDHVKIVRPEPLGELVKRVDTQELEGIVAKKLNSPYELRRSPNWLKSRPTEGFDLPIMGYEESNKPDRPFRSLILVWKGRELQASSGLTNEDLHYALEKFAEAKIVRTTREAGRDKHYFESPVGHAEVVFTSTPRLPVRFPRVVRLRFDK